MPIYKLGAVGWWAVKESRVSAQRQKEGEKETVLLQQPDDTRTHTCTHTQWYIEVLMTVILLGCYRKDCWATHTHTHTAGRHWGPCASPPVRICILLLAGRPTNCPGSRGRRRLWLRGETLLRKCLIRLILSVETLLHHTSLPEARLIGADRQGLSFGDRKAWWPLPDLASLGPGGAWRLVSPPSSP